MHLITLKIHTIVSVYVFQRYGYWGKWCFCNKTSWTKLLHDLFQWLCVNQVKMEVRRQTNYIPFRN